jgi:2-haloacid dehalogenase
LSTAANQTYKPDPRAYELGVERLGLKKEEIAFAAFGGQHVQQLAGLVDFVLN